MEANKKNLENIIFWIRFAIEFLLLELKKECFEHPYCLGTPMSCLNNVLSYCPNDGFDNNIVMLCASFHRLNGLKITP